MELFPSRPFEDTYESKHYRFEFPNLNVMLNDYLIVHLFFCILFALLWGMVFLFC